MSDKVYYVNFYWNHLLPALFCVGMLGDLIPQGRYDIHTFMRHTADQRCQEIYFLKGGQLLVNDEPLAFLYDTETGSYFKTR